MSQKDWEEHLALMPVALHIPSALQPPPAGSHHRQEKGGQFGRSHEMKQANFCYTSMVN